MRVLLVLLIPLLAGCVAPEQEDPLVGWCPQWLEGPGAASFAGNGTDTWTFAPNMSYGGHPLDLFRIELDVEVNGTLQVRAEGNGSAAIRDHRRPIHDQVQPMAVFTGDASGVLLEAVLTPIDGEVQSSPLTLRFQVDGQATWSGTVTPHYRICGA